MRPIKKLSLIVGLFAIVLNGCMPEDLGVTNIPEVKHEIVVSSQVLPDTTLVVMLTRTLGALDANSGTDPMVLIEKIGITDAIVEVMIDGESYSLTQVYSGVYATKDVPIIPGRECSLSVNSKTFGEVSASTLVQTRIPFDSVKASIYYNGFNDFFAEVNYQLSDPPVKNYYMINVQSAKREDRLRQMVNPDSYTRLLVDEAFNGQLYSEMFRTIPKNFESGDSVAVSLSNVDAEYYRFLKLRLVNRYGFVEYFSEPIDYPTNVVGGRGFFNVYIPDTHILVL